MAATCQMVQFDGRQLRSPIKNYNSFFPHFVSPLAADNAIRSAPSSVCQEGGPFSSHPPRPDAFDVYARKGFRETVFFLFFFHSFPCARLSFYLVHSAPGWRGFLF